MQPGDTHYHKSIKDYIRKEFNKWIIEEGTAETN
jgi:hypothetical protein